MSLSRVFGLIPSYDQLYLPDPDQQFVWGWNNEGQLGTTSHGNDVVDFKSLSKNFVTKDVAIGLSHSLLLSRNGEVYTVGKGLYGRLGNGGDTSLRSLFKVSISTRVIKIAAGSFHSAFITERHQLYTFGRGNSGQLGHGDNQDQYIPRQVTIHESVDLIACGSDHTAFITMNGSAFAMGSNKYMQVTGDPSLELVNVPTFVPLNPKVADMTARSSNVTGLSCGSSFTVAIKAGSLYAWGLNSNGQCGASPKEAECVKVPQLIKLSSKKRERIVFVAVSSGQLHSMALTDEGELYGWGSAQHGQLGFGGFAGVVELDTSIPIRIGESLLNEYITKVSCGTYHTVALTAEGLIYAWGTNDYGQASPDTRGMINVPQRLRTPASASATPIMNVFAGGRSSMAIRFYPTLIRVRESTYRSDIEGIFTNNTNTDCEVILKDKSGNIEKTNIILSHKIFLTRSTLFSEQLDSSTIDVSEDFESYSKLNSFVSDLYKDGVDDLVANHLFLYINNPMYSDVTIRVREKTFHAHKCILVARSNKLKIQLESFFQEGINNTIFIDNFSPEVYQCFIHYLYTDKLGVNEENAVDLLFLAHEENSERMLELVQEYLVNGVDDDNVSPLYDISIQLDLKLLGDQCLYYIAKNMDSVSQTESFNELPEELKKKLLASSVPFANNKKEKEKNCILM